MNVINKLKDFMSTLSFEEQQKVDELFKESKRYFPSLKSNSNVKDIDVINKTLQYLCLGDLCNYLSFYLLCCIKYLIDYKYLNENNEDIMGTLSESISFLLNKSVGKFNGNYDYMVDKHYLFSKPSLIVSTLALFMSNDSDKLKFFISQRYRNIPYCSAQIAAYYKLNDEMYKDCLYYLLNRCKNLSAKFNFIIPENYENTDETRFTFFLKTFLSNDVVKGWWDKYGMEEPLYEKEEDYVECHLRKNVKALVDKKSKKAPSLLHLHLPQIFHTNNSSDVKNKIANSCNGIELKQALDVLTCYLDTTIYSKGDLVNKSTETRMKRDNTKVPLWVSFKVFSPFVDNSSQVTGLQQQLYVGNVEDKKSRYTVIMKECDKLYPVGVSNKKDKDGKVTKVLVKADNFYYVRKNISGVISLLNDCLIANESIVINDHGVEKKESLHSFALAYLPKEYNEQVSVINETSDTRSTSTMFKAMNKEADS